tara:strand:- start:11987 stop:12205 length:219 start_codon:yes stop_codon:yes gene_type:complete
MLTCQVNKSKPIAIYKKSQNYKNSDNSDNFINNPIIQDEYSLKKNFFDPNKFSPPNDWSARLIYRLNNKYTN